MLVSRSTRFQSNLTNCPDIALISCQDQIRMLDAEGYPHTSLVEHDMWLEFRQVSQLSDELHADERILQMSPHQSLNQDILS